MKWLYVFLIIFLLVGSFIIINHYSLNIKNSSEDRKTFASAFFDWVFQVGKSTKNTAGYAIKQEWLPKDVNETNKTKE